MFASVIRVLLKGYLPIYHLPPMKLQDVLNEVKKMIKVTNPDFDIVIKRLHLKYDTKLVTFVICKERNLIGQF